MKRLVFVCILSAFAAGAAPGDGNPSGQPAPQPSTDQNQQPVRLTRKDSVTVVGIISDGYRATTVDVGNLSDLPLLDTPVSISTATRQLLDDQQSRLLSDVIKNDASIGEDYAPVGYYGNFTIRGFPLDLATGLQINGLTIAGEQDVALENKEVVEFLKGVDGMQGGVSSPGGLINYVTKRPALTKSITVQSDQRGSSYGALDLGGVFGSRDQFGLRLNLAGESMHSYVHNTNGSRLFGSLAADWRISGSSVLKADFEYQNKVQRSVSGYQLLGGTTVPTNVSPSVLPGSQWWAKPNTFDTYNTSLRYDFSLNSKWHGHVAASRSNSLIDDNVAYAYGCYYVESCSTATPGYFFSATGDYDVYDYRSPGELRRDDQVEGIVSGQIRTGPIRHDVTVGVSAFRRTVDLANAVYDYVGTDNIYGPLLAFQPSPNSPGEVYRRLDSRQYSVLAIDRITLARQWVVTVGVRDVTLRDHASDEPHVVTRKTDKNVVLPQYSLMYKPQAQVSIYGSYSVGQSLGAQAPFWASNGNAFLAPTISRQIEGGVKYDFGSRLNLSAAVFRVSVPFQYPRPDDSEAGITFVEQGRETHTGLELGAAGRVAKWLRLTASATTMRAVANGTGTPSYDDRQVINTPRFRGTVSGDYSVPGIRGLRLLPGWLYSSRKSATRDASVYVPGYNLFNIGIAYTPERANNHFTYRLYCDNLFDKRYWKDTGAAYGDTFLHLGAPRTVRFSIVYGF
jgi:iron complex outermembrane recepter protein